MRVRFSSASVWLACILIGGFNGSAKQLLARPIRIMGPGATNLPYSVNDGAGNQWMIYPGGWLQIQGNQSLYSQGAMLMINGNQVGVRNNQARIDEKTGELVIESLQSNGFTVTRRILMNKEEGYARYIDIIKNTQAQEQTVNVGVQSNMNFSLEQSQSIPDPRKKDQSIAWAASNQNGRAVFEMYAGKGSKIAPTINTQPNNNFVQGTLQLTIPGGKEVAFIHLHGVTDSPESAAKFVQDFKESKLMSSLPAELRKIVVNFTTGNGYIGDRELLRGDLFDVVEIHGGDQMRGTLKEKSYTLNTFYGTVNLPAERVLGIINVGEFRPRQLLVTLDGEIFGGKLVKDTLDLQMTSGQTVQIPLAQVMRVGYRKRAGEPEEWTFDKPFVALRSGDRVGVQMPDQPVEVATRYGSLKLDPRSIATIVFQSEDHGVHDIYLTDGSKFSGLVNAAEFDMKLSGTIGTGTSTAPTEQPVKFPASSVARIQFSGPPVELDDDESPTLRLMNEDVLAGALSGQMKLDTAFDTLTLNAGEIKKLTRDAESGVDVQITLWDASILSGQLQDPMLKCNLESGVSVSIPLSLVREYNQPQPQPAAGMVDKIKLSVVQLNDNDWKRRDRAEAELTAMGPVVSGVLKQMRPSQPPEAQQRIDQILAKLAKKKSP
jgi:hypothetical protein